jgi:16S rRNA (cytosine1402-N4)-methyltransferase
MDAAALSTAVKRLKPYGDRHTLVKASFTELERTAQDQAFTPADGVLFDLGLSSLQLADAARGFSFARKGSLDMRFDSSQQMTAENVVNRYSQQRLADLIFRFGEEPLARRIARAIVEARPLSNTTDLVAVIAKAGTSGRRRIHPATRTFQALRIEVNGELGSIRSGLEQAVRVLRKGGRLVVIAYHSLEDRIVKVYMNREKSACICPPGIPECACGHRPTLRLVTRRVTRPSRDEVIANPRSRSARMRVAERL